MIIYIGTYNIKPESMETFLGLLKSEGLPILKRHMGRLVGYYVTFVGPLNQVVNVWENESIAHLDQCRERRDADPA